MVKYKPLTLVFRVTLVLCVCVCVCVYGCCVCVCKSKCVRPGTAAFVMANGCHIHQLEKIIVVVVLLNIVCFLRGQVIGVESPCNYRVWLPVNSNK